MISVSGGQESGHSRVGSYAQDPLKRLQPGCLLGLGSHLKGLWLWKDLVPCWLLPGSHPQFPAIWASPESSSQRSHSRWLHQSQQERDSTNITEVSIFHNPVTEVCTFAIFHWVEESHRSCPLTQKDLDMAGLPGVGITGAILQPAHHPYWYIYWSNSE